MIFLAFSTLTVKFAGLLFKIPLTALLGESGMGYFNSAYTLFTWFYVTATSGLPVSCAIMVSGEKQRGNFANIKRIFRLTLIIFTVLGLLSSGMMIFGADFFASLMKVEKSRFAMIAIAPTLFFICQSSALRGYFQGMGKLVPHGLAQMTEALGKLFLGLALAKYALSLGKSVEEAAAYAAFGLTVGVALGMLVLYLSLSFVHNDECKITESDRNIVKELIKNSLPITLTACISGLSGLLDSLLLTRGLHSLGFSQSEAAAVWGNYSSLALPMFNLPPVLIYPLLYSLTPEISRLLAAKDNCAAAEKCRKTLELSVAVAIPCAVGLAVFAEPILRLFFAEDLAVRGAKMLILLAPSSFLLCIFGNFNIILQSCKKSQYSLLATILGILTKTTATILLIPKIGKYAAPISTFLCYLVSIIVSVCALEKTELRGIFSHKFCIRWTVYSAVSVSFAVIIYSKFGILPALFSAVAVYLMLGSKRMIKCFKE